MSAIFSVQNLQTFLRRKKLASAFTGRTARPGASAASATESWTVLLQNALRKAAKADRRMALVLLSHQS